MVVALLAFAACAHATADDAARRQAATCAGPGYLEVRNHSGGNVEVYAMRTGDRRYLGMAAPGTKSFAIDDVTDLGVTYLVHDPVSAGSAVTVTWRARRARAGATGIDLELRCAGTVRAR